MEIEFNPSRLPKPDLEASQPVTRRTTQPAVSSTTQPFEMTAALESKLNEIPLVRPEVVSRAKTLVADVQYPPNEVLNSLSTLLALHINS
jgi:hypothetical protein